MQCYYNCTVLVKSTTTFCTVPCFFTKEILWAFFWETQNSNRYQIPWYTKHTKYCIRNVYFNDIHRKVGGGRGGKNLNVVSCYYLDAHTDTSCEELWWDIDADTFQWLSQCLLSLIIIQTFLNKFSQVFSIFWNKCDTTGLC